MLDETTTGEIVDIIKDAQTMKFIDDALKKHYLLTTLTKEMRLELIDRMNFMRLRDGNVIFEQGHPGVSFYVISKGTVSMEIDKRVEKKLEVGDSFGELALINGSPRNETAIACGLVELWQLKRASFRETLSKLSIMLYNENKAFINSVPLFQILTDDQKELIITHVVVTVYKPGEQIITEGEAGDLFYMIKDGLVRITKEGKEVRQMKKGEFFGEQALLYNCTRTATISAITPTTCATINRESLTNALGNQLQTVIYKNSISMSIESSQFLGSLTEDQIEALIPEMTIRTYNQGETVVAAGEKLGAYLYLVLNGALKSNGQIFATKFTCLGDSKLERNVTGAFKFEVVASQEGTDVAWISRERFEACIGGGFADIRAKNSALAALKRVSVFSNLCLVKFHAILDAMETTEFTAGTSIVQQGDPGSTFFILRQGTVDCFVEDVKVRTLNEFDYFGERSILLNTPRTATAIASTDVVLWQLNQDAFLSVVDEDIRRLLLNRIELQDDNVQFTDLEFIKVLGQGMFGDVILCKSSQNRNVYALKAVSRKKIDAYKITSNLQNERSILMMIDHVFIMKLVKTFKDTKRVYFLTEFINGLDLFDVLRKIGICKEPEARFYTAVFVLVLEHLAQRSIVHRDLKPENVMIDDMGYPRLIDFGTAKVVDGRTFTMVGTPHYMAPEVIMGKGYRVKADLWSLGCMVYEFVAGGVPFGEEIEDTFKIYEAVLQQRLAYPSSVRRMAQLTNLIGILLNRNPALRQDPVRLKKHRFFADFNWDDLQYKKMKAPYIHRAQEVGKPNGQSIEAVLALNEHNDANLKVKHPAPFGWDEDF